MGLHRQPKIKRYVHGQHYHQQKRFARRSRRIVLLLIIILTGIGGFLVWDALNQTNQSDRPSAPSGTTITSYAPKRNSFKTSYFQFDTGPHWQAITKETTATKYVYRSMRGSLNINQELIIYINTPNPDLTATRVLPVGLSSDGHLASTGDVSEHCKKGFTPGMRRQPTRITFAGVSFVCDPDSSFYNIVVGWKGGSAPFTLNRPAGGTASYGLAYRDVTTADDSSELLKIISTFRPL
jgi:hypothetical protein